MDKEKKKGGKLRKIVSWIVSLAVIIVLFKACTGSFDQAASDATNGAFGSGDHSSKELSSYLSYTEEELQKALGVEKNDMGYYPNDTEANFICMDGKVYSAMINQNHNKDAEYTLFGITLGQDSNKVSGMLGKDFELLDSSDAVGGTRDTYIHKTAGHLLAVDYNAQSVVTAVSCVVGDGAETEKVIDGSMDEIMEWLDSIGAYDETMKDWDAEYILNFYNSIREDMRSWDVSFEDMRTFLKKFSPNFSVEEVDQLTDYQIYVEYKNVNGYGEYVDAEEDTGANDFIYVATDEELKAYLRDNTYIGATFQFPAYMIGGTNIDNKYSAYISVEDTTGHNGAVSVYITDPGVNLFAGDYILFTGVYEGVYDNGFLKFATVSVQLQ